MKSAIRFLGIIAIAAVIGSTMTACGDGGGAGTGKFEGFWFDRDPNNPTTNFAFFLFTGNEFIYQTYYQSQRGLSRPGTFTYTSSDITFIAPPGTWTTWTTPYTLNGNKLFLQNRGDGNSVTETKENTKNATLADLQGQWTGSGVSNITFNNNTFSWQSESGRSYITGATFAINGNEITITPHDSSVPSQLWGKHFCALVGNLLFLSRADSFLSGTYIKQ